MTIGSALHSFFSSFGITAYKNTSVPEDVNMPFLVYTDTIGNAGEQTSITVNLYYLTDSESIPNAKAKQIYDAIGLGGKILQCDGGAIWIKRGSPWCQSVFDDNDRSIKRRYINITAEFILNS